MLITLIVFLLVLSVLVMIHEAGHFIAAKKFGIKVEEFGFGLPPRLFSIRRGETLYSINWLPIGGFVRLFGEEGEENDSAKIKAQSTKLKNKKIHLKKVDKRAFYARPVWQRAVVIAAGVVMNFALGVIILSFLFTQGVMVPTNRVHVENVIKGAPAEVVGLIKGDIIVAIKIPITPVSESDGRQVIPNDKQYKVFTVKSGDDLVKTTKNYLDQEIVLSVKRANEELNFNITPRKDYPKDQGPMGVVISNYEIKKYSLLEAPILGTREAIKLSYELGKGIIVTLWKIATFHSVAKDVAGPIGIAQMTGEAVKSGDAAILELMGLLSLNLAIVNILPIPALDGGRLFFVLFEGVTRRRVRVQLERLVHQIGWFILIGLVILVTLNDLVRILGK